MRKKFTLVLALIIFISSFLPSPALAYGKNFNINMPNREMELNPENFNINMPNREMELNPENFNQDEADAPEEESKPIVEKDYDDEKISRGGVAKH